MAGPRPPLTRAMLLHWLSQNPGTTANQIARALHSSPDAIRRLLQAATRDRQTQTRPGPRGNILYYTSNHPDSRPIQNGRCDACGQTWENSGPIHCGGHDGCHQMFSSLQTYLRHQPHGTCTPPADNGLRLRTNHLGQQLWIIHRALPGPGRKPAHPRTQPPPAGV